MTGAHDGLTALATTERVVLPALVAATRRRRRAVVCEAVTDSRMHAYCTRARPHAYARTTRTHAPRARATPNRETSDGFEIQVQSKWACASLAFVARGDTLLRGQASLRGRRAPAVTKIRVSCSMSRARSAAVTLPTPSSRHPSMPASVRRGSWGKTWVTSRTRNAFFVEAKILRCGGNPLHPVPIRPSVLCCDFATGQKQCPAWPSPPNRKLLFCGGQRGAGSAA